MPYSCAPEPMEFAIPDTIIEGEVLNFSASFSSSDYVQSVRLLIYTDNSSDYFPIELWDAGDIWLRSVYNLEAGTYTWELVVNNEVVRTGQFVVLEQEEEGNQWMLAFMAVFLIVAFVAIEMTLKPGRYGLRKKPVDDGTENETNGEEEDEPAPAEEQNSSEENSSVNQ